MGYYSKVKQNTSPNYLLLFFVQGGATSQGWARTIVTSLGFSSLCQGNRQGLRSKAAEAARQGVGFSPWGDFTRPTAGGPPSPHLPESISRRKHRGTRHHQPGTPSGDVTCYAALGSLD